MMIPALVKKISQENERGARNTPPPSRARVNKQYEYELRLE